MNQTSPPVPPPVTDTEGEPFPCPHCGQLLAATCRVCVACGKEITAEQLAGARALEQAALTETLAAAAPSVAATFSWRIFLYVLLASWLLTTVTLSKLGLFNGQLVLSLVQVAAAAWVAFDAQSRGIPRPWRWAAGTLLLWIVFFPWYLSRRRMPEAACPFVESKRGPFVSFLVLGLALALLLVLVLTGFNPGAMGK